MGWLVAIIVLPVLFIIGAVIAVMKLTVIVIRLVFAPARVLSRW